MRNLLTNAIKYCEDGDQIFVKVDKKDDKALCSVTDSGIGIAETERVKIFERFYKAPGKYSYTYPGMGLGLYICKEIIKGHSEDIWVVSKPGAGSTFYFTLPLA